MSLGSFGQHAASDPDTIYLDPTQPRQENEPRQRRAASSAQAQKPDECLLFFISGNPGLIQFYDPFLSNLHARLTKLASEDEATPNGSQASRRRARFTICGHSYAGFEISPSAARRTAPLGLSEQIDVQEGFLLEDITRLRAQSGQRVKVILVGHSVGAYILLELVRRHCQARKSEGADFDLLGGILLFPTIAHIAESPKGRVARIVLPLPGVVRGVAALARAIVALLSAAALWRVVQWFTGFPDFSTGTVVAFLTSKMGVWQALYLARDEMRMITEDEWDHEVWGAAAPASIATPRRSTRDKTKQGNDPRPWKLVLFWAQKDHWVANHTRDQIIAARGRRDLDSSDIDHDDGGPRPTTEMVLDDRGTPHDFCTTLRNSDYVAGLAQGWIESIIDQHGG